MRPSLRHFSFTACAVVALVWAASPALVEPKPKGPVEVITRAFLGNYIEDITYINNGPHAKHIAAITGDGVYGIPVQSNSDQSLKKLFDLGEIIQNMGYPRGFTWIESEKVFAFVDGGACRKLFISDHHGKLLETRSIQYLGGFAPVACEGLAYIPPTSPVYPDHLLLAAWEDFAVGGGRVEVLTRSG